MQISIRNILTFSLLFFATAQMAQTDILEGTTSFITSQNIYVRFVSTEGIDTGDTLTVFDGGEFRACLIVQQKSSTSCVCVAIEECKLTKGSKVYFRNKSITVIPKLESVGEEVSIQTTEVFDTDSTALQVNDYIEPSEPDIQQIRARISASSYSSLDPDYGDRHRTMLRMSFNASRINNSKISMESYVNYRRNFDESNKNSNIANSFLRVYNLNLSYQVDSSMLISIGRKINRKMSSVGAIDGVQLDKNFGRVFTGAIVGFRPDLIAFDFNPNLLEYGLYFGMDIRSENSYGQLTFGVLEQRNGSAIDRRYSYLQYTSTLYRNLNLFASAELDLYSLESNIKSYSPELTNIYLSVRYRFSRKISLSVAYDARKRIIYYETLRTELERLLADDEARQGLRIRLNIRPLNLVYTGISFSKRFQSSNQNKSDNINAFVSLTRIPGVGGRLSLNYNLNKSNFLESTILAARHSRTIVRGKLEADFYYRNVRYNYFNTETYFEQYYIGMGLSWNVLKEINLNVLIEQSQVGDRGRYRLNTKLIKRFRSR